MGVVTKIKKSKRDDQVVNVYVDDRFKFKLRQDSLLKYGIYVGQSIDGATLEKLSQTANFDALLQQAIRLISYRPHSVDELAHKLVQKLKIRGIAEEPSSIQKVLDWMIERNYLNDTEFAKWFADQRLRQHRSHVQIRLELKQKRVSDELIKQALNSIYGDAAVEVEFEQALALAQKRLPAYGRYDSRQKREKIIGFLQRRGFGWDVIQKVIEQVGDF